ISKSQSVRGDKNATILLASERGQPPLDLFCIMHIERHELDLERRGEGFGRFEEYNMGRGLRMPHEPDTLDMRRDLLEQLQPFSAHCWRVPICEPSEVVVGPRIVADKTGADGITDRSSPPKIVLRQISGDDARMKV